MGEMSKDVKDLFVSFFDTTEEFATGVINGDVYSKKLALIATKSEAFASDGKNSEDVGRLTEFTDAARHFYSLYGEDAARTCANMLCACFAEDHETFDSLTDDLEVQLYLRELNIKQSKEG